MTLRSFGIAFAWLCAALSFGQLDSITYKAPKGWKETPQNGAITFVPTNLKEGEAFVVMMFAAENSGQSSAEKQLKEVADRLNKGTKILNTGEAGKVPAAGGSFWAQAFYVEDEELGKHARIVGCLVAGSRRVPFLIFMDPVELAEKYDADLMSLVGSIKFKAVSAPAKPNPTEKASNSAGKIPRGNTPDLFPGMPGWLPSGVGRPVPQTGIVAGRPQGVWYLQSAGDVYTYVFFSDGTYLSGPRWGGGSIVDVEAQRSITPTSVGTFSIEDGKFSTKAPGFKSRADVFSSGKDQYGRFFKSGNSIYRELKAPTIKTLEGSWQRLATRYVFHVDGTVQYGQMRTDGTWDTSSILKGNYEIEGFMVRMQFENSGQPPVIFSIGICTPDLISMGIRNFIRMK